MNRILPSIILLIFIASTAQAAPSGRGNGQGMHGRQSMQMQHIQQNLGLSQEQADQIRSIRQNGGSREDIRNVLTEEQRAQMDEHRANRSGNGDRPRYGNGQGYGAGQAPAADDSSEPGDG